MTKPPKGHGLFTRKGVKWLHSLNLEPVECYLRIMDPLSEEIRRLSLKLKHLARGDEDVRLLMTVPGIGYYTALLVKAEMGDVDRFGSGEQLCSYAGIVPSTHSSGGVTRHGRITKEGSRWLRWAMVEAAMTHLKYDTGITRAYHRIAERRGRQVAQVAAARRLLMCCWSVLKHKRPYRPFSRSGLENPRGSAVPVVDASAIEEAWMRSHIALWWADRRMPFIVGGLKA